MEDLQHKDRPALAWQVLDRLPQEPRALVSERLGFRRCASRYDARGVHVPQRIGLGDPVMTAGVDGKIAGGREEKGARDADALPVLVGAQERLLDDVFGLLL